MKPINIHNIRNAIKYLVVLGDVCMTIHCLLLLCNVDWFLTEFFFSLSVCGFVVLMMSSYILGFCDKFRLVLTHSFVVLCCIIFQRSFGFGYCVDILRIIMFAIGAALLANLFIKNND